MGLPNEYSDLELLVSAISFDGIKKSIILLFHLRIEVQVVTIKLCVFNFNKTSKIIPNRNVSLEFVRLNGLTLYSVVEQMNWCLLANCDNDEVILVYVIWYPYWWWTTVLWLYSFSLVQTINLYALSRKIRSVLFPLSLWY